LPPNYRIILVFRGFFKVFFQNFSQVNPVRNSSGALNPAGIILKYNPAAAAGPEGLWPGGSSGVIFLTG
jgi:hypothetical protein